MKAPTVALSTGLVALAALVPVDAWGAGDTTYGRVEGALELAPAVGATLASYGARPTLELRGRYLSMAGVFVTYEEGFGTRVDPRRLLATGIEVRPLFFARWLKDKEVGSAFVDLAIDSFARTWGPRKQQIREAVLTVAQVGLGEAEMKGLHIALGLARGLALTDEGLALHEVRRHGPAPVYDESWDDILLQRLRAAALAGRSPNRGPVAELRRHDHAHQTEYVQTLRAWLEAQGDPAAAGNRLGVHENTVRYRLRKMADITTLQLDDAKKRLAMMIELAATDCD